MNKNVYVVATIRPWNLQVYKEIIGCYPGNWHLISKVQALTPARIKKLKPRYIFFPHWSNIVPRSILELAECVCFHETALPFGRGGSPIQNLIVRGYKKTKITALKMTHELDAGPIYLQRPLSLAGRAEDIYQRSARTVAAMIKEIIAKEPAPKAQKGKVVIFKRRIPEQSLVPQELKTMGKLFDHLRMLDAMEYPKAYIDHGGFRYEFSRPTLGTGEIAANVRITKTRARRGK